jgi:hypothetical protein
MDQKTKLNKKKQEKQNDKTKIQLRRAKFSRHGTSCHSLYG